MAVIGIFVDTFPLRRHSEPLRVGFNEFSPYISVKADGRPGGLAVDVINEAARRSGQSLVWRQVDDGETALGDGRIDVYPLMVATRDRLNRLHFSEYWWQTSPQVVSSLRRPINHVADAAGRIIGVRKSGLVTSVAKSLFPRSKLIVKPTVEALLKSLCTGEVDGLFMDVRSLELYLVDRPPPCQNLKPKFTSMTGSDILLGTASTRRARNRADRLYAHIDEVVADGPVANLASSYLIPTPESNQQLAPWLQGRQQFLWMEAGCAAIGCLIVVFVFIGVRMRGAQRAAEDARLGREESEQRFHAFMDHLAANAFMKDRAGRLVYTNNADARMFERLPEECLGQTNFDLMPHHVAEQLRANDLMVLESNCARQFTESIPDGEEIYGIGSLANFPFRAARAKCSSGELPSRSPKCSRCRQPCGRANRAIARS